MGVPVVALAGERHVARISVSFLTHVGAPELIAAIWTGMSTWPSASRRTGRGSPSCGAR